MTIPDDQRKAWFEDRRGAIAGQPSPTSRAGRSATTITIKGDIYPVNIELVLRGSSRRRPREDEKQPALPARCTSRSCTGRQGHRRHLLAQGRLARERRRRRARPSTRCPRTPTRRRSPRRRTSSWPTSSRMMGNIKGLISAIGLCVATAILMLAANTMAMAVRERTTRGRRDARRSASQPGKVLGDHRRRIAGDRPRLARPRLRDGLSPLQPDGFRLPGLVWTPMS